VGNEDAERLLRIPLNLNGRSNSDVMRPWMNALDVARQPRGMTSSILVPSMTEAEAALHEGPFVYLKRYVKSQRASARSGDRTGVRWWRLQLPRAEMREALAPLKRYICTTRV
jgi:hypothetical protein